MTELVREAPANLVNDTPARTTPSLLAVGGVLAAVGASSCCVLPLALFMLGVSGAWIGNLTALAPYQPLFVAAAVVLIGIGFRQVYRKPAAVCADSDCATPASHRLAKAGLWTAALLVAAALAFPYLARFLLDT